MQLKKEKQRGGEKKVKMRLKTRILGDGLFPEKKTDESIFIYIRISRQCDGCDKALPGEIFSGLKIFSALFCALSCCYVFLDLCSISSPKNNTIKG